MRKFRPHQRAAWNYAAPRDAIALFMQMRLGKSLVFIRWARLKANGGAVLIITPTTTFHVWKRELAAEGHGAVILSGSSKAKLNSLLAGKHVGRQFYIVNPEGVRAFPGIVDELDFAVVGCDESGGWLTNPRSQISKTLRRKLADIPFKALLTGLPDPNGADDYVTQMIFAFGQFMGFKDYWPWRLKYMEPRFGGGWQLLRGSAKSIRRAVRKLAFRMTTKQAGLFVPKIRQTRTVELPPAVRKLFKECRRDFSVGETDTKFAAVAHMWLRRLAGGSIPGGGEFHGFKVNELIRLLTTELKGQRVVVFASFIAEIKAIHAALKKAKIKAHRITGLTKQKFRAGLLDDFDAGRVDVIVVQSKIGRYGLNMAAASTIVFYSNDEDWDVRSQCEARCDHMNKREPVLIVDLVTAGTLDQAILDLLAGKKVSAAYFAHAMTLKVKHMMGMAA